MWGAGSRVSKNQQGPQKRLRTILDCFGTFWTQLYAFMLHLLICRKSRTSGSAKEPTIYTLLFFRDTRLQYLGCIGSESHNFLSVLGHNEKEKNNKLLSKVRFAQICRNFYKH